MLDRPMQPQIPSFIFIGPDKSGSTWLYELCQAHPEIFLPDVKELFFFDRYYDRGFEWYAAKFKGRTAAHHAAGEICHDYLFSAEAAQRIARDIPNVKVMVMVRDPIARSFSHWQFRQRSGDTRKSFEEDLQDTPAIIDHSCYSRHLAPYIQHFGLERLGVFEFGDLKKDANELTQRIFSFVGVGDMDQSAFDPSKTRNAASTARNASLVYALRQGGNGLRRLGLERFVGKTKAHPMFQKLLFRKMNKNNKPNLDPYTCKCLQERFAPFNQDLETMLGRDIPELWKSYDT